MSSPCFFVAGATGYTGRNLVENALARGIRVVAHLRPGSPRAATVGAAMSAQGAELAVVPWESDALAAELKRVQPTHVFGLLGITKAGAKREGQRTGHTPSYAEVDTGMSMMLFGLAAEHLAEAQLVYLSSLGADSPRGNAYLQARHTVEQALMAGASPWTVVRPSFISGSDRDEDRMGERFGSVVANVGLGLVGMLGGRSLRDRYATATGAELGQCMVTAALSPASVNRVLDMKDLRNDFSDT